MPSSPDRAPLAGVGSFERDLGRREQLEARSSGRPRLVAASARPIDPPGATGSSRPACSGSTKPPPMERAAEQERDLLVPVPAADQRLSLVREELQRERKGTGRPRRVDDQRHARARGRDLHVSPDLRASTAQTPNRIAVARRSALGSTPTTSAPRRCSRAAVSTPTGQAQDHDGLLDARAGVERDLGAVSTRGNIVATRPSTASSTISEAGTVNRSWWGWNAKTVEPSPIRAPGSAPPRPRSCSRREGESEATGQRGSVSSTSRRRSSSPR